MEEPFSCQKADEDECGGHHRSVQQPCKKCLKHAHNDHDHLPFPHTWTQVYPLAFCRWEGNSPLPIVPWLHSRQTVLCKIPPQRPTSPSSVYTPMDRERQLHRGEHHVQGRGKFSSQVLLCTHVAQHNRLDATSLLPCAL